MTQDNQNNECLNDALDDDLVVGQVLASVVNSSSQRNEPQEATNCTQVEHDEIGPEDLDYDNSSPDEVNHVEVNQEDVNCANSEHEENQEQEVAMDTEEQIEEQVEEQIEEQIEEQSQEQTHTPTEPIEQEPEKEEIYVVEKILDKKISACGGVKYLVKWLNYPSKDNSWEPVDNLVDCEDSMIEFELERARKLAAKHSKDTANQVDSNMSKSDSCREFEINDIMHLIKVGGERYFLISLANTTKKAFIRASLANRIFPTRVIDFYIKHMRFTPAKA